MQARIFSSAFLIFVLISRMVAGQSDRQVISGTVLDIVTGEVLIGAYIYVSDGKSATTSNAQGHFTLWLDSQDFNREITITHIGYSPVALHFDLFASRQMVYLSPAHFALDEVFVSSQKVKDFMVPEVSVFKLERRELNLLPSFAGEKDLLLYLQKTPGVSLAEIGRASCRERV